MVFTSFFNFNFDFDFDFVCLFVQNQIKLREAEQRYKALNAEAIDKMVVLLDDKIICAQLPLFACMASKQSMVDRWVVAANKWRDVSQQPTLFGASHAHPKYSSALAAPAPRASSVDAARPSRHRTRPRPTPQSERNVHVV
jgi:hypothetical protein